MVETRCLPYDLKTGQLGVRYLDVNSTVNIQNPDDSGYPLVDFSLNRNSITGDHSITAHLETIHARLDHFIVKKL
jgi:hypothetical protein